MPAGTRLGVCAKHVHGRSERRGSLPRGRLNVSGMVHTCVRVPHRYFFQGITVAVVMLSIDRCGEKMGQHHTHISCGDRESPIMHLMYLFDNCVFAVSTASARHTRHMRQQ